jgi:hypothetical protein
MVNIFKKLGFKSSIPLVLLLIAIVSFGLLLILVRLPENGFVKLLDKPMSTDCIEYKGNVDCDTLPYLFIFAIIPAIIFFGPAMIIMKIFSIKFIPEGWIIASIIFSFVVYFLIDYLVEIFLKKRKRIPKRGVIFEAK